MKYKLGNTASVVTLITTTLLACSGMVIPSSQAATFPGLTFACDNGMDDQSASNSNVLYGMYGNGASVDLATFSRAGGYDEATRCQMISWKLNQANLNNQLKYITHGTQNGQNIICAVENYSPNACKSDTTEEKGYTFLFTIAHGADPEVELNRFLTRLSSSRNVGQILHDSASQQLYVNFEAYVQDAFRGIADVSTGEILESNSSNVAGE